MLSIRDCPPHNELHTVCQYPRYYDALYFPEYHTSVFEDEHTVCEWLRAELQTHLVTCACAFGSRVPSQSRVFVHYSLENFVIEFGSAEVVLSVGDVESSMFSFCKVVRRLFLNYDLADVWTESALYVLSQLPPWLFRNDCDYRQPLNELTRSDLLRAARNVGTVGRHRKTDLIQLLVYDFVTARTALLDSDDLSQNRAVCSARHFEDKYGASVAAAFRNNVSADHYREVLSDTHCIADSDPQWLALSFRDMHLILQRQPKSVIIESLHRIPSYVRPPYNSRSVRASSSALLDHIRRRIFFLYSLPTRAFFREFFSVLPFDLKYMDSRGILIERVLACEYGDQVILHLSRPLPSQSESHKIQRREQKVKVAEDAAVRELEITQLWPTVVPDDIVFQCLEDYRIGTVWEPPLICSVCGLERKDTVDVDIPAIGEPPLDFFPLHVTDPSICNGEDFEYGLDVINGAILERRGFKHYHADGLVMRICCECHSALKKKKLPRLALANRLYRGQLPDEFKDLTWIEEMVCAKYRNTAHITRIYQSSDPSQPKVFHGNTCAHEMNVVSTASVLPRTPADVNGMLSIVFIGPGKFKPENLGPLFKIRKRKVWRFLVWLKSHNHLYADISLDPEIMDLYPEDGVLPDILHGVFEDHETNVDKTFANETAGFSEHPAELIRTHSGSDSAVVFLEKMGVSDPEGIRLTGRTFTASALKNLVPSSSELPDMVLHRSSAAVPEYNNPNLVPGMFPTLFPFGLGGFDDPSRKTKLSFDAQANAFLDVPDKSFRHHHSYIFVVLNISQRRAAHLQTHFTVRKSNFDDVARSLTSVSPSVLHSLAHHLQHEGKLDTLSSEEQNAMTLLKQVNTISARIPGSQASKIFTRNEIRSYFSEFGLPHIYFTFNPSVTHSPIFQVMVGDHSVDLTSRFPHLVPSHERALRLANDPVAAADFFEFCVSCVFQYLFGWDYTKRKSSLQGGILGHLRAFYGTSEFTERGSLHGHFLIWLIGGSNPNEIHRRLKEEPGFDKRFFEFFEDIIQHELPDIEMEHDKKYEPRIERPPVPPKPVLGISPDALHKWHMFMDSEVKKLGEVLQRHSCKPVCHKYGNFDKCRFLFPHEIVPESYFDSDSNSVVLKCLDSMVNYFNRYILVYCRHNHDIKCILSGKAAKAAMFYITDYITKMDLKTYEMLSLLSRAVGSLPVEPELPPRQRARTLLHKCLAQFSRQQQIHAQQAARYIRGHNDSISSHDSTPMMSGLLIYFVQKQYNIATHDDTSNMMDEDVEQPYLRIQTDQHGTLVCKNQVTDYWYRPPALADMTFL